MSDATTLRALAERVEKLTGPCRETDVRIAEAVGWRREPLAGLWRRPDTALIALPPLYTASLDAAAGLVPDGWTWARFHGGTIECAVWDERRHKAERANGRTPALALTAAALLARAAEMEGRDG